MLGDKKGMRALVQANLERGAGPLRRSRKGSARRRAVVLVATAALTAAAVPASGSATTWRYKVHRGVRLTRLRFGSIPNEVRVIRVTPSRGPRIDLATAGKAFPMAAKTSSMAAALPKAILATNADFGADGAPKHVTMVDGELWTSGVGKGAAFAVSDDGESAFVGTPHLQMKVTHVGGQRIGRIAKWNAGAPKGSAINGY